MKTIKLSYSILSQWSEGHFEEAIGGYLGKPLPATPAMELGKLKHQIWANHIQATKTLPTELGGHSLVNPIVEQKWQKIIPFSDNYQILLRGVIDLEDEGILTDHKCGLSTPSGYLDKLQLDYYKLLRPDATVGRYLCHNPYKCDANCTENNHSCYTVGIKFLNEENAEQALNHIITYGGELIQYLEANKLIKDFKG
jgi:hypothetical protein